jgi:hypothetical protein
MNEFNTKLNRTVNPSKVYHLPQHILSYSTFVTSNSHHGISNLFFNFGCGLNICSYGSGVGSAISIAACSKHLLPITASRHTWHVELGFVCWPKAALHARHCCVLALFYFNTFRISSCIPNSNYFEIVCFYQIKNKVMSNNFNPDIFIIRLFALFGKISKAIYRIIKKFIEFYCSIWICSSLSNSPKCRSYRELLLNSTLLLF